MDKLKKLGLDGLDEMYAELKERIEVLEKRMSIVDNKLKIVTQMKDLFDEPQKEPKCEKCNDYGFYFDNKNEPLKRVECDCKEQPFTLKGKEQYLELSDNGVWTIVDDYDKEQDEHGMYHIIINKSDVDKAYDEICKEIDKDSDTWEGSIIIPEWLYKKRAKEIVKRIIGRD